MRYSVNLFKSIHKVEYDWDQTAMIAQDAVYCYFKFLHKKYSDENTSEDYNKNEQSNMNLNTILYGPPGTGKTYNTISYAVAIVEGKSIEYIRGEKDRKSVLRRFRDYLSNERIQFTTFHQSMSYEDFIEGIKPVMGENDSESVLYEIRDGIFKKTCIESAFEKLNIVDQSNYELLSFDNRYDLLLDRISDSPEPFEIELKTGNYIKIINVSDRGNLEVKHNSGTRSYIVSKQRLEKVYKSLKNYDNVSNINTAIREIIGGSNASAYWAINKYLHEMESVKRDSANFSFTYEQKKKLVSEGIVDYKIKPKNYVLIIDEINRGNIAQIFGELITLLEPNKRAGEEEALEITLPYSQENFSVPNNLYVLGTMNTADRSVEALDTALRRRFSFIEMAPKPEIINEVENYDGELDLVALLTAINSRIERLLDKDHCIGHSYFLQVKNDDDLISAFKDKVIPLLEEYFLGDMAKVGLVLGETFVEQSESSKMYELKPFNGVDDGYAEDMKEKKVFRITHSDKWQFETIYE